MKITIESWKIELVFAFPLEPSPKVYIKSTPINLSYHAISLIEVNQLTVISTVHFIKFDRI